jgi:hypothetical protein
MKIRTLEQLSDCIANDLAWRKKELSALKGLIQSSSTSSASKQRVLLRSGSTILYAHWEGFIKFAASKYLEYIAMQKLRYEELSSNFVALSFKKQLETASTTKKATVFTEAIDFIRSQLNGKGTSINCLIAKILGLKPLPFRCSSQ